MNRSKSKKIWLTAILTCSIGLVATGNSVVQSKQEAHCSSLYRADFTISGVSCAACLRGIEHDLLRSQGVVKAEVSIRSPYHAVVVYDQRKTEPMLLWLPQKRKGYDMNGLKVIPVDKLTNSPLLPVGPEVRKDSRLINPPEPVLD